MDHDGIISLNLPTAVQSPRSKGDGRYDDDHPVDDISAEYVLDTVTYDDASVYVLNDDMIVDDVPTEIPGVLAGCGRCFYVSKNIRNIK